MSDVIPKPGKYRQQNGMPAEVKWVGDGKALGFDQNGESTCWHASTGKWVEADHREDYFVHITGPWIPDPPEPPPGFQVMPKEYVAKPGDMVRCGHHLKWWPIEGEHSWKWKSAGELNRTHLTRAPHYIASPIPKPFSISEHGIGVYETRDGREEPVTKPAPYGWEGKSPKDGWYDNGRRVSFEDRPGDLVRYLRPLPKPEQPQEEWTPTNELRNRSLDLVGLVAKDKRTNGMYSVYANGNWFSVVLEQKWTCGEKSEWRPIPIETEGA